MVLTPFFLSLFWLGTTALNTGARGIFATSKYTFPVNMVFFVSSSGHEDKYFWERSQKTLWGGISTGKSINNMKQTPGDYLLHACLSGCDVKIVQMNYETLKPFLSLFSKQATSRRHVSLCNFVAKKHVRIYEIIRIDRQLILPRALVCPENISLCVNILEWPWSMAGGQADKNCTSSAAHLYYEPGSFMTRK